jgi:hypothetical protein
VRPTLRRSLAANKGLELTASSVRSCLTPTSGSSSGLALACKSSSNPTLQRVTAILLLGVFLWLAAACAYNQPTATSSYTEVFSPSGNLRIRAYLYKPHGNGPLPVVIYNHGKRMG